MTRRAVLQGLLASCGIGSLRGAWGLESIGTSNHAAQGLACKVLQSPIDADQESPVVTAIALHPSATKLASAGDNHRVLIWDLEAERVSQQLLGHQDWIRSVAYSADGRFLASCGNDRQILIWNGTDGTREATLPPHNEAVSSLVFGHTSRWLATCGFESTMSLYDLTIGQLSDIEPVRLEGPCRDIRAVTFAPRDTFLAAAGRNGRIQIWGLPTGRVHHEWVGHLRRIRGLAFSPDGTRLVSCGEDRFVYVWNVRDWNLESQLPTDARKNFAVAFLDDDTIAVGGTDNAIQLWNLNSRERVGLLLGHTGSVAALDTKNGVLISGSFDTTIRIWEPQVSPSLP